ncbi:MAG: DegV family protein [Clostridia bacterium]|nr:DegV family protein [Clostridia bacterium]
MAQFTLSTDSCCDELKSNLKENNIEFISMNYIHNDVIFEDHFDSLDEYNTFYEEQKNGKFFTTTALNHYQLKEYFENILKVHKKDVLHITLSSGLSGTYQITKDVADEINTKSKNKIYVVDSLNATQGQNFLLNYAKTLRDEEKDVETASKLVNKLASKLNVYFFLIDLETLKKGGRISGAKAVMAKIMQLRPILRFNSKGELEVVEKVIGVKKVIRTLFENYVKNHDPEYDNLPVYVTYSGEQTNADELITLLQEKAGVTKIVCKPVGPVIGSHTGPYLTGIIFVSKEKRK